MKRKILYEPMRFSVMRYCFKTPVLFDPDFESLLGHHFPY